MLRTFENLRAVKSGADQSDPHAGVTMREQPAPSPEPIDDLQSDEQKEALRLLPDEEIERLASAVQARQESLAQEAAKLARDAEDAAVAFKRSPTAKALSEKEVAAQLAVNARAEAEAHAHASSNVNVLAEHKRRIQLRRLRELRAKMEWRAEAESTAERIAQLVDNFQASLRAEFATLQRQAAERNALFEETRELERIVGDGSNHGRLETVMLAEFVNARLRGRYDEFGGYVDETKTAVHLGFSPGSSPSRATCSLRLRMNTPEVTK